MCFKISKGLDEKEIYNRIILPTLLNNLAQGTINNKPVTGSLNVGQSTAGDTPELDAATEAIAKKMEDLNKRVENILGAGSDPFDQSDRTDPASRMVMTTPSMIPHALAAGQEGLAQIAGIEQLLSGFDSTMANLGDKISLEEQGQLVSELKKGIQIITEGGSQEELNKIAELFRTGSNTLSNPEQLLKAQAPLIKALEDLRQELAGTNASGYVPNFTDIKAYQESYNREVGALRKRGVPNAESQVYMGHVPELKTGANKAGAGFFNKIDEPLGPQQGISRAKRYGVDPKRHGSRIPNYAKPVDSNLDNMVRSQGGEWIKREQDKKFDNKEEREASLLKAAMEEGNYTAEAAQVLVGQQRSVPLGSPSVTVAGVTQSLIAAAALGYGLYREGKGHNRAMWEAIEADSRYIERRKFMDQMRENMGGKKFDNLSASQQKAMKKFAIGKGKSSLGGDNPYSNLWDNQKVRLDAAGKRGVTRRGLGVAGRAVKKFVPWASAAFAAATLRGMEDEPSMLSEGIGMVAPVAGYILGKKDPAKAAYIAAGEVPIVEWVLMGLDELGIGEMIAGDYAEPIGGSGNRFLGMEGEWDELMEHNERMTDPAYAKRFTELMRRSRLGADGRRAEDNAGRKEAVAQHLAARQGIRDKRTSLAEQFPQMFNTQQTQDPESKKYAEANLRAAIRAPNNPELGGGHSLNGILADVMNGKASFKDAIRQFPALENKDIALEQDDLGNNFIMVDGYQLQTNPNDAGEFMKGLLMKSNEELFIPNFANTKGSAARGFIPNFVRSEADLGGRIKNDKERDAFFKKKWETTRANRGPQRGAFDISRYDRMEPLFEKYLQVAGAESTLPRTWEALRDKEIEVRQAGGLQGPLSKFAAWMHSGGGQEWIQERMAAKMEAEKKQKAAEAAARALAEQQERMRKDQKAKSLAAWHAENGLPPSYKEFLSAAVKSGSSEDQIRAQVEALPDGDLMWPYAKQYVDPLLAKRKQQELVSRVTKSMSDPGTTTWLQEESANISFDGALLGGGRMDLLRDAPPGVSDEDWKKLSTEERHNALTTILERGLAAEINATYPTREKAAKEEYDKYPYGTNLRKIGGGSLFSEIYKSSNLSHLLESGDQLYGGGTDKARAYDKNLGTGYRGEIYKTTLNEREVTYWKGKKQLEKYLDELFDQGNDHTMSVQRLQAKGFIPNFSAQLAETLQARAMGASPSVKAKNSRGTIQGKPFILNNQEKEYTGQELVNMGLPKPQNNDSMVLRNYGPKTQGKELAQNLGMANSGFVPNFANGTGTDMSGFTEGAKEVADSMGIFKETTERLLQGVTSTITTDLNVTGLDIPVIVEAIKEALAPAIAKAVSQQVAAQANVNPIDPSPPVVL